MLSAEDPISRTTQRQKEEGDIKKPDQPYEQELSIDHSEDINYSEKTDNSSIESPSYKEGMDQKKQEIREFLKSKTEIYSVNDATLEKTRLPQENIKIPQENYEKVDTIETIRSPAQKARRHNELSSSSDPEPISRLIDKAKYSVKVTNQEKEIPVATNSFITFRTASVSQAVVKRAKIVGFILAVLTLMVIIIANF